MVTALNKKPGPSMGWESQGKRNIETGVRDLRISYLLKHEKKIKYLI
jgi:hypothetical protein